MRLIHFLLRLLTLVRHQSYCSCMAQTPTTASKAGQAGHTFRAMREGAGLTVRALADRAEISHSTISRWERAEREISESTYEHLARTLADFMAGKWAA